MRQNKERDHSKCGETYDLMLWQTLIIDIHDEGGHL